jgi:hypothetical protein
VSDEKRTDPPEPAPLRCDFCGRAVASVRRIALDSGYDRLARPHRVQYACEPCSERKERERQARG